MISKIQYGIIDLETKKFHRLLDYQPATEDSEPLYFFTPWINIDSTKQRNCVNLEFLQKNPDNFFIVNDNNVAIIIDIDDINKLTIGRIFVLSDFICERLKIDRITRFLRIDYAVDSNEETEFQYYNCYNFLEENYQCVDSQYFANQKKDNSLITYANKIIADTISQANNEITFGKEIARTMGIANKVIADLQMANIDLENNLPKENEVEDFGIGLENMQEKY